MHLVQDPGLQPSSKKFARKTFGASYRGSTCFVKYSLHQKLSVFLLQRHLLCIAHLKVFFLQIFYSKVRTPICGCDSATNNATIAAAAAATAAAAIRSRIAGVLKKMDFLEKYQITRVVTVI